MINWIVSFEGFHYKNYASVQIKKKLDSLSSANQIRENNESASQSKASVPRQPHGVTWQESRIALWSPFLENARVFSEIAKFFSEF